MSEHTALEEDARDLRARLAAAEAERDEANSRTLRMWERAKAAEAKAAAAEAVRRHVVRERDALRAKVAAVASAGLAEPDLSSWFRETPESLAMLAEETAALAESEKRYAVGRTEPALTVEVEADLYKRAEAIIAQVGAAVPVSVESIVNMALQSWLEGADSVG